MSYGSPSPILQDVIAMQNAGILPGGPGSGNTTAGSATGLTATVAPLQLGTWSSAGGTVTLPSTDGTFFVGIDLYRRIPIVLTRLGHRGWIPTARVVISGGAVTSTTAIAPVMPTTRIPRTMAKWLLNKPVKIVVMGSSLDQWGSGNGGWVSLLSRMAGGAGNYRLPSNTLIHNVARASSQIYHQIAQLGFASSHTGDGTQGHGYPGLGQKFGINGRSALFQDADLVIIGSLANYSYTPEMLEAEMRQLRKQGVEVICLTDNAYGATFNPPTQAGFNSAAWYSAGPDLIKLAEKYGFEIADTAAYVAAECILRGSSSATTVYNNDQTHMFSAGYGRIVGPTGAGASGHEVYARCVRSIASIAVTETGTEIYTKGNFASQYTWAGSSAYTSTVSGGTLTLVEGAGGNIFEGLGTLLPNTRYCIEIDFVSATHSYSWAITNRVGSLIFGGQYQNNVVGGAQNLYWEFTTPAAASGRNAGWEIYTYGSGVPGATIVLKKVSCRTYADVVADLAIERKAETFGPIPAMLQLDPTIGGDALIILPADEQNYKAGGSDAGTIGTITGAYDRSLSFLQLWTTGVADSAYAEPTNYVAPSNDVLILPAGKSFYLSGYNATGFAIMAAGNNAATYLNVFRNGVQIATNIGVNPGTDPFIFWLIAPGTLANTGLRGNDSIKVTVASGSLALYAGVVYTAEQEYIPVEQIQTVGTWLSKRTSPAGLPSICTDTLNDYAYVTNPGKRVQWIVSGDAGSKTYNLASGSNVTTANAALAAGNINAVGGLIGNPGDTAMIQCNVSGAGNTDGTGHALHVGGAIVVLDR